VNRLFSALIFLCFVSPAKADESFWYSSILGGGSWGWIEGKNTCATNPHAINFSKDGSRMFYSWRHTYPDVTYQVLYADKNSLTSIIMGEERRTNNGDKVVWQLNLIDDNTYCWRRTDWPSDSCTRNIQRCEAGSPPHGIAILRGRASLADKRARQA